MYSRERLCTYYMLYCTSLGPCRLTTRAAESPRGREDAGWEAAYRSVGERGSKRDPRRPGRRLGAEHERSFRGYPPKVGGAVFSRLYWQSPGNLPP